jgi:hypothetical protein
MKHIKLIMAILITIIGLSIAGCYTMLSHPAVIEDRVNSEDNTYTADEQTEIDYSYDCLQCHSAQNQVFIHRFYNHYAEPDESLNNYYWDSAPRAQYFYSSPWWLSDYYHSGAAVPMQRENGDEALPRPDDYSRRQPAQSTFPGSASMSSGSSVGGVSVSTGSASSGSADDASKEKSAPESSTRRPAETKSKSSGTTDSKDSTQTKTKKKSE